MCTSKEFLRLAGARHKRDKKGGEGKQKGGKEVKGMSLRISDVVTPMVWQLA
jgi:hypothetical protein